MKPFIPKSLPFEDIVWEPLVSELSQANRAVANYNGLLHSVPNPAVLLSPMTTQEAVLSSKLEGTVATLGEVLRYEAGDEPEQKSRRNDIQEILNYRSALRSAEAELVYRPFSLDMLNGLHKILLSSVRGKDKTPGRFRITQNWIGSPGCQIEEAEFIPPEPFFIQDHMENWERYYHYQEKDLLVQLAILHAQLEIIHPYNDGNGRMGRIIIPLFLYEKKILNSPMFYISAYLETNRAEYVKRLRALDDNFSSWEKWILFFLKAVAAQAKQNTEKALAIKTLYEELKQQVIETTHSQYAVLLLDQIFVNPTFKASDLDLGEHGPTRQAVSNLLRALRETGILDVLRQGRGRRAQVLSLTRLVELCEA